MASDKQKRQDKRAAALRDNLKRRKEKMKAELSAPRENSEKECRSEQEE